MEIDSRAFMRRAHEILVARGWKDTADLVLILLKATREHGALDRRLIAGLIPPTFLAANDVRRADVVDALEEAVGGLTFAEAPQPMTAEQVPTLLMLSADPSDQSRLATQRELRLIREELEKSGRTKGIAMEVRPGLVHSDMARYILDTKPAVIHFAGHGGLDGIFLEDDSGGTHLVSTEALEMLFSQPSVRSTVQLVVLNSCLSENQAVAISSQVPVVVGMSSSVTDAGAIAFSRGLYMALAKGLDVAEAFEFGRTSVAVHGSSDTDIPRIFAAHSELAKSVRPLA